MAIGSATAAEKRRAAAAARGIRLKGVRRPKSAAVTNLLNWLGERVPNHPNKPPHLVTYTEFNYGSFVQNLIAPILDDE